MDKQQAILLIKNHMAHHGIWEYPHIFLGEALNMAIEALSPPNEPLKQDELREMDEPVWCSCKPIEGGNGYWCLCKHGCIVTPSGNSYDVGEIPHWVFYRRPPEGEEDK